MANKSIEAYCFGTHNNTVAFAVNQTPDSCPVCHKGIEPIWKYGWIESNSAYAVYQCPRNDCRELFLSKFERDIDPLSDAYIFKGSSPYKPIKHDFPVEVRTISEKFCDIYDEAYEAEQRRLMSICGAGYRRALEFLIKDFLIKEKGCDADKVKETLLGTCINNYLDDKKIQECAKRAAWLGNDYTHYYQIWQNKDLSDLKALIGLTVNWIHNDYLTKKILSEMPEGKSKGRK